MENPEVVDVGVIGLKDDYTGDELPRYVTPVFSEMKLNPGCGFVEHT